MSDFSKIVSQSKQLGLEPSVIAKVIQLIEYAKQNDIELYVKEGKLRMREYANPKVDMKDLKDIFNPTKFPF